MGDYDGEGGHSHNIVGFGKRRVPKRRDLLPLGKWLTKARPVSWGSGRIYMTIFDREEDIKDCFPSLPAPQRFSMPYGMTQMSAMVSDTLPEFKAVNPEEGDIIDQPLEVGDLVVVKCDLQFANTGNQYPTSYQLPKKLSEQFVSFDAETKEYENIVKSHYVPVLNLNVFLEIEGFLSLSSYDYEEAMTDTKLWDRSDLGGFRQKDYIPKRTKMDAMTSEERSKIVFGKGGESDRVQFYNFVWRDTDLITGIPGIVETRKEKHWFIDNWSSNIYKSPRDVGREQFVKFPLVGVIGTLMETRVVVHGLSKSGDYIGGNEYQTTFYRILFHDRVPLWVDAPVWKCPDPLCLPICLPLP